MEELSQGKVRPPVTICQPCFMGRGSTLGKYEAENIIGYRVSKIWTIALKEGLIERTDAANLEKNWIKF